MRRYREVLEKIASLEQYDQDGIEEGWQAKACRAIALAKQAVEPSTDPMESLVSDLFELTDRYSNKPADDLPTYVEVIGAIELVKMHLLLELRDKGGLT